MRVKVIEKRPGAFFVYRRTFPLWPYIWTYVDVFIGDNAEIRAIEYAKVVQRQRVVWESWQ